MNDTPKFFREPHTLSSAPPDSPILVALSGGADSVTLLHLLRAYREKFGCRLYAAHLNHGIRGEEYGYEALRDENFCRKLCKELDVELFVKQTDVPSLSRQRGKSLETQARDERYSFFAEIMNNHGIKLLATAHNADDNLETQIFNICRGCGTDGLVGIPQSRPMSGVIDGLIIRPLLSAPKKQILEFCKNKNLEYVTDSTNLFDDCTRNRIRHIIIPELENLFGNPQKSAERLSRAALEDTRYINASVDVFEKENVRYTEKESMISLDSLSSAPLPIQKRTVSRLYSHVSGQKLENVHTSDILCLLEKGRPHSSVSLPLGFCARIENSCLVISKSEPTEEVSPYELPLQDGMNLIRGTDFAVCIYEKNTCPCISEELKVYKLYTSAVIKSDKILSLSARNRKEGDTVRDGGMTKKVRRLMCDKKIPLEMRDSLPLICHGEDIVYIPGCAIADGYKRDGIKETLIDIYVKMKG